MEERQKVKAFISLKWYISKNGCERDLNLWSPSFLSVQTHKCWSKQSTNE